MATSRRPDPLDDRPFPGDILLDRPTSRPLAKRREERCGDAAGADQGVGGEAPEDGAYWLGHVAHGEGGYDG